MPLLPEDVLAVVAVAGEVAKGVVSRNAEAEDREARWPAEAMQALADAGLAGLHVPRRYGGGGLGLLALAAVSETLAEQSASTGLCFAMHCVGTAVIAAKATPFQIERYLVPIAGGRHFTTLALSEPGSGVHFYFPESTAERVDDGFRISGTKSFVTNGGQADSYVVSVAADGAGAEEGMFSCVLLDATRPGVQWGDPWRGLGMRSNSSRSMRLRDVVVPAENLLGDEGDQLWYAFEVVAPYFLMAMAGTYLGVAKAAVEEARVHLGQRRHSHSGELLGSSPVLCHRLGELWTELTKTRALVHRAAANADAGNPDALTEVLACKAAAGDTAVYVANEAMTLCGGMAYAENGRLARVLRDARASHVMAPSSDMLKMWVGRSLLKLPLL